MYPLAKKNYKNYCTKSGIYDVGPLLTLCGWVLKIIIERSLIETSPDNIFVKWYTNRHLGYERVYLPCAVCDDDRP